MPPLYMIAKPGTLQLPDVGFCFEGDTYGARFGCFDGDADGKDCADSYKADVFIYGYVALRSCSSSSSSSKLVRNVVAVPLQQSLLL